MLKTYFRDRALSAVKKQMNMEKRGGSPIRSVDTTVINPNYDLFLNACRGSSGEDVRSCCGNLRGN